MNAFTPRAEQVLVFSRKEAHRFGHRYVGTEHLLLGLIRLRHGVAVQILAEFGFDLASTRADLKGRVGLGPDASTASKIPYTASFEKVIALAAKEAKMLGYTLVDAEHLLLGLLNDPDCDAAKMLGFRGVEIERIRMKTLECLSSSSVQPALSSSTKRVVDFRRLPIILAGSLAYFQRILSRGSRLSKRSRNIERTRRELNNFPSHTASRSH